MIRTEKGALSMQSGGRCSPRARAATVEPRWGLAGLDEREAGGQRAQTTLPRISGIKGREKEWKLEILNFRLKD